MQQVDQRLDIVGETASRFAKPGKTIRIKCPSVACSNRKNRFAETLSITSGDGRVLYQCHHCSAKGVVWEKPRMEVALKPRRELMKKPLTQEAINWLLARGIETKNIPASVEVFSTDAWFAELQRTAPAIGISYMVDGAYTAAKLRSLTDKFHSQNGAARSFLGIDGVSGDELIIVEGEWDFLACHQAGIKNVVSVPNGAPTSVSRDINPSEDRKYSYLWSAREKINAAKRVILFCDADDAGSNLAEELSRRIGRAKCWRVDLPADCKDANDVLLKQGPEALREIVANAEPWPVSGLYGADHFFAQVDDLYTNGIQSGVSTGLKCIDDLYTIFPGQLTVVTGVPSSGKSEFIDQLMVNLAERSGWRFGIASFENDPRIHLTNLISKRARAPFFPGQMQRMNPGQLAEAKHFISDHFAFIHNADGSMHDIDEIIERAKVAVLRYGIRGLVIDPYSYIMRDKNESETEFVSNILTKVRVFAQAYDVHVWFVAHPTKVQKDEAGQYKVPTGYDISGSAQWFAKADNGFTIHRDPVGQPHLVEFHCWKIRYSFAGKQGLSLLVYDKETRCYREPDASGEIDWGENIN